MVMKFKKIQKQLCMAKQKNNKNRFNYSCFFVIIKLVIKMEITIDIDALRNDLINYFGSAMQYNKVAMMDLIKVEQASDNEIVNIALKNGFNLYDYEIKGKRR